MFALIFLVENSFYYESATELSSDFKTGTLVHIKWKIPAQTQPAKKKTVSADFYCWLVNVKIKTVISSFWRRWKSLFAKTVVNFPFVATVF